VIVTECLIMNEKSDEFAVEGEADKMRQCPNR
jgi:hypothetical protein